MFLHPAADIFRHKCKLFHRILCLPDLNFTFERFFKLLCREAEYILCQDLKGISVRFTTGIGFYHGFAARICRILLCLGGFAIVRGILGYVSHRDHLRRRNDGKQLL